MRKAFTMVEIVFVIVIIGVLSAVALPKMIGIRDRAIATECVNDVGILISEISIGYTSKKDFQDWSQKKLSDITNITLNTVEGNGITNGDDLVNQTDIVYRCQGEDIVTLKAAKDPSGKYQLSVAMDNATTVPAANKAVNALISTHGVATKIYEL